ncbi:MAG: hypothetical protein D6795_05260 [Deltaproteobacteria bacterium]|nr:MAG: hypothetical protein D6795_05260 [Deltaproteobacteria bacterium]
MAGAGSGDARRRDDRNRRPGQRQAPRPDHPPRRGGKGGDRSASARLRAGTETSGRKTAPQDHRRPPTPRQHRRLGGTTVGILKRLGRLARANWNATLGDLGGRWRKGQDSAFEEGFWDDAFLDEEPTYRYHDPSPPREDPQLARYYAQLEVEYGADLQTVKKAWKRLMRKYHPDFHANDPVKQQIAQELTMKLTTAYREIEKYWEAQGKAS